MLARDPFPPLLLLVGLAPIFIWSAINPRDPLTWYLEAAPVIAGLLVLAVTYPRFKFTHLTYTLIWLHSAILLVGAHFTYAEVPLFNWLRDAFELSRNHYDRLGHFAQGFFPAIIVREMLLRASPLKRGAWLFFLVVCVCLAFSATHELFEWGVAVVSGSAADAFLATQGDVWDTQWDMALAMLGAIVSLLTLGALHDRSLKKRAMGRD